MGSNLPTFGLWRGVVGRATSRTYRKRGTPQHPQRAQQSIYVQTQCNQYNWATLLNIENVSACELDLSYQVVPWSHKRPGCQILGLARVLPVYFPPSSTPVLEEGDPVPEGHRSGGQPTLCFPNAWLNSGKSRPVLPPPKPIPEFNRPPRTEGLEATGEGSSSDLVWLLTLKRRATRQMVPRS